MVNRRTIATLLSSIALLFGTFALATPAHATFRGNNGRLAFRRYLNNAHSHGAIFTIKPDGTGERQVTHPRSGVLDAEPDWSPNGEWIAFERIAAHCCRKPSQRDRLFKVRADGTHLTLLSERLPCGKEAGQCAADDYPAWSPSGTRIAFTRDFGPALVGEQGVGLFVMRGDGTHVRQITEKITLTRFQDAKPQWSPDGTRLVFDRQRLSDGQHAVFTVRLDGTHAQRLTPWRLSPDDNPDWSPDGRWILFHSHGDDGKQDNLYLVHPNGSDLHRITHSHGGMYSWLSSSFSPDGTMITVSRAPGVGNAGRADVYVMNVDGTGLFDVTGSASWESNNDWGSTR
jgi:TolB protein